MSANDEIKRLKLIIAKQKKIITGQKKDQEIIARRYLRLSIEYDKTLTAARYMTKSYDRKCAQIAGKKFEDSDDEGEDSDDEEEEVVLSAND